MSRQRKYVNVIILFEGVSLFLVAIPSDWRHVDHAVAELNESPSLHGDVDVGKVAEDPVDQALDVVFAEIFLQALHFDGLSIFEGIQPVLRKGPVNDFKVIVSQLLLGLGQIRSSNDTYRPAPSSTPMRRSSQTLTNSDSLAQILQELDHLTCGLLPHRSAPAGFSTDPYLAGCRESPVDVWPKDHQERTWHNL